MHERLPLNALRAFEAAGRRRSVTAAATELNVTPGAVSKQLKTLETLVRSKLFHRGAEGIVLTPAGEALLAGVGAGLEGLSQAVQAAAEAEVQGQLTIYCASSFASSWLIPRLGRFSERHVNVEITLIPATPQAPFGRIEAPSGRADLSIVFGRPHAPEAEIRRLRPMEFFPVCSPVLLSEASHLSRPADLLEHALIDGPWRMKAYSSAWEEWFRDKGLSVPRTARWLLFEDFSHCLAAARAGLGVALGDPVNCDEDLRLGRLVSLAPRLGRMRSDEECYFLLTPSGVTPSPQCVSFIDWLTREIGEE